MAGHIRRKLHKALVFLNGDGADLLLADAGIFQDGIDDLLFRDVVVGVSSSPVR